MANTLKNLGLMRIILTALVLLGMMSGAFYFTSHIATPDMALLYTDLDVGDAGRIVSKLEDRGIPVQVRGGGTEVFVPVDQVARLRMDMAEAGLPNGGSMGYEVFDQGDSLGTTYFVQNINHLRALEGEMARTIRTLTPVASARVHLVLPQREIFSRDKQEPSASIVLRMQSPGRLDESRVNAIQHLVAAGVPGLVPEKVSIIDDRGNLLSRGSGDVESTFSQRMEDMKLAHENRLARSIESLVERVVGLGKVRAEISAEMDFDRLTENSEIYDPDGQVVRSTQTIDDKSSASEAGLAEGVTVGNETPAGEEGEGGGAQSKNETNRNEKTINYEITKTIRSHVKEIGGLKKLSVAVLVDGNYAKEGGAYTPRSKEEIEQIKKLVQSSIGFNEERGDAIEIANLQFASLDVDGGTPPEDTTIAGFERHHIVRIIETAILALIGLLMLLLVIKPLINKLIEEAPSQEPDPKPLEANPETLPSPEATASLESPKEEDTISLDAVQGKVKASSYGRVADTIDNYPEETAAIMRSWMNESE